MFTTILALREYYAKELCLTCSIKYCAAFVTAFSVNQLAT